MYLQHIEDPDKLKVEVSFLGDTPGSEDEADAVAPEAVGIEDSA